MCGNLLRKTTKARRESRVERDRRGVELISEVRVEDDAIIANRPALISLTSFTQSPVAISIWNWRQ